MKKVIGVFALFLILSVNFVSAQTLTNKFVSVLASGAADENGLISHSVDVKAGAQVKASLVEGSTDMFFRGIYCSNGKSFTGFWVRQNIIKGINLTSGLMARSITLINRVSPVIGESGFESPAQAAVPGSALGASLNANIGLVSVSGGVFRLAKEKLPEYNAGISIKNDSLNFSFGVGAYRSDIDKGVAGTVTAGMVKTMLYSSDLKRSMLFELNHEVLGFYFTLVDDLKNDEGDDIEFGITKSFSIPELSSASSLIGLAYNTQQKKIITYFWMYL